ncbi:hypothetical protein THF1C08_80239 [Vibrio jasicida]|uniref:Uncharacterized protein n=1 Tax=Vibrio jasicida TaxID=766224 RepID=A0AAU9QWP7_9VIBR|nr:hypothetical protein THF1C08_80239 [Vibrio jasicida]CAH1603519.1 hypothetical protein THF1A12_70238 [Vibrio jasicida]
MYQLKKLERMLNIKIKESELGDAYVVLPTVYGTYYVISNYAREPDTYLITSDKYDDFIKVNNRDLATRLHDFIAQAGGLIERANVKGRKPPTQNAKELFKEFYVANQL